MVQMLRRAGIDALVFLGLSFLPTPAQVSAVFGALVLLASVPALAVALVRVVIGHHTRIPWWRLFFVWLAIVFWSMLMPQWFTARYWSHAFQMSAVVWIQATVFLVSLGFLGDGLWALIVAGWTASRDQARRLSVRDMVRFVWAHLVLSDLVKEVSVDD